MQRVGLLPCPRLMPQGRECSTQEGWRLRYGRLTWHTDPGGFPFSSLSRVTNPRVGVPESFFKEVLFELSPEGRVRVGKVGKTIAQRAVQAKRTSEEGPSMTQARQ